ncbi:hypothetical protein CPT_Mano_056 [Achromobacter phage Mano]|uniref:Uncharacterized protein n=1 Tax=Achromobacter phage Mano TaxID=2767570 RepID=A0A7L8G8K4_9CAUD|nr:hypothetical protein KB680_gp35 [Achromobacter phage Mano]QOE32788.1 hypothetical protein CPT_Mano_056 [Achromobacter phage Mano]
MSSTSVSILTDGNTENWVWFYIYNLPANKPVAVAHAIRDSERNITLLVDARGKIYSPHLTGRRMYSWRAGFSSKVAHALVSLGVITKAQADAHDKAVEAYNKAQSAKFDLERLEDYAKQYGVKLSGRGLAKLRELAKAA